MTDKNSYFVNKLFWLIEKASIFLSKLKNHIWNKIELTTDKTIFNLFDWSIFSTCDALHEVTEAVFKIENLKTIAFVEEVEVLTLIIPTLLAMTEKFSTKLLLKETFAWKSSINLISLIIKLTARRFFRVDAEKSE